MLLQATNIVKSYTKTKTVTPVLKGISLEVSDGEFLAVTGRSGAGKSTLLHILGSIDKPDSGSVSFTLEGKKLTISEMSPRELAKFRNRNIGFVFQFHHLLPEFTALENIMLPAMIAGDSYSVAEKKSKSLLKVVGLDIREAHRPTELSGGEQQRVAIARAIINNPKVVFADEPTGNLDLESTKNILQLIRHLQQESGSTFIIATHSDEVAACATRVINISDGTVGSKTK